MNLPSYARGLLTELGYAQQNKNDEHAEQVRGELNRVIDDARQAAQAEMAALDKQDPQRADYQALVKDLDGFQSAKGSKQTARAAAAPEKA